jgi:FlaA1/EpsC-like NDP-sugar epimerase
MATRKRKTSAQAERLLPPEPSTRQLRAVILGAGIAGRLVLEELHRRRGGYVPVGFLDDDARLRRRRIGGLPVLGPLSALPELAKRHRLDLAILAIPSAPGEVSRRVAHVARGCGIELRILPGLYGIIQRDTEAGLARPVSLGDFFRRAPIPFDVEAMRQALTG